MQLIHSHEIGYIEGKHSQELQSDYAIFTTNVTYRHPDNIEVIGIGKSEPLLTECHSMETSLVIYKYDAPS